jgi:hypothetical protein
MRSQKIIAQPTSYCMDGGGRDSASGVAVRWKTIMQSSFGVPAFAEIAESSLRNFGLLVGCGNSAGNCEANEHREDGAIPVGEVALDRA